MYVQLGELEPEPYKMAFINPWSICNKTAAIHDFIISKNLDVLAVTESWLKSDGDAKLERIFEHELLPQSHHMIHVPRPSERKGGGIAILHRKSIKINITSLSGSPFKQFEYAVCTLNLQKTFVKLIVLYRPLPTKVNKLKVKSFWREFEKFLGLHASCKEELIITGDLNFHLDKPNHPDSLKLNLLLEEFDLVQKVQVATHKAGHILDILVVRTDSTVLNSMYVLDPGLCNDDGKQIDDHYAIHWTLALSKPITQSKVIHFRDFKNIDYAQFMEDLAQTELTKINEKTTLTIYELVQLYNDTFEMLLNKHAPLNTQTIHIRSNTDTKWFNERIRDSKRKRRQSERLWRRTGLEVHHQQYRQRCADTNRLVQSSKMEEYSRAFSECENDPKAIHKLANSLFGGKPKGLMPAADNPLKLANNFMNFFCDKVRIIRQDLQDNLQNDNEFIQILSRFDTRSNENLSNFSKTTAEEVKDIVLSSNSKSCKLDPVPTDVLKRVIDLVSAPIATIINRSFLEGVVPTNMKKAIIKPVIKKSSFDSEEISNYRPVSNLSYLSKIMEKTVNARLETHLENNNLLDPFQSAYRKHHSTETVLVKMINDILIALDKGLATPYYAGCICCI